MQRTNPMQRKRPLRQQSAEIEQLLWLRLRVLKEQGWHFRKASPFRSFLLPFVEHEALLVVELDGIRSIARDRLLREAGYTILRFPRADAMHNLNAVLDTIRAVLQDRSGSLA
jgi:very-short-patch-repair endonuclease